MFDPHLLDAALTAVPSGAWSLPSTYAGTHVHHGYRRTALVDAGTVRPEGEAFRFVFDELEPVYTAWLSWIDPGGFIVPHRDGGPWRERWQVAIRPAGTLHQEPQPVEPLPGEAFRVCHWEPHWLENPTDGPRVHLVADLARHLPKSVLPFKVYPIPAQLEALVASAN